MLPFVRAGGAALAWKGPAAAAEAGEAARACEILGGGKMSQYPYSLPERGSFYIICAVKIRQTPPAYPRKAGKPTKSPIS